MKVHGALRPFMHSLFQGQPDITTGEAVEEIRHYLATQTDGDRFYDDAASIGFASLWGGFTGTLRRKAQKQIGKAKVRTTATGITIAVLENMKLPIGDGVISPTYADSTAIMLRRSLRLLVNQSRGLQEQVDLVRRFIKLLDKAAKETGDPNLTLRDAFSRGLITFAMVEAA